MELLQAASDSSHNGKFVASRRSLEAPVYLRTSAIFYRCANRRSFNSFINTAKDTASNVPISPTNLDAEQKSCCLLASPWRLTMPE